MGNACKSILMSFLTSTSASCANRVLSTNIKPCSAKQREEFFVRIKSAHSDNFILFLILLVIH